MPNGYRTIFPEHRKVALEPQEFDSPGPGEILLRTERTLISTGTELTLLSGDFPRPVSAWANWAKYPMPVGYSNAAVVEEVGEGVTRVKVGDRVASSALHASYARASENHVWLIPDNVDSEAATFSTLAEIVLGGVHLSRIMLGESVVIIGAGLLGQLAAQYCRIAGAWPVIVIDPVEMRLKMAGKSANHLLPMLAEEEKTKEEVKRLTKGRMADIVFDITGNPTAMVGACRLARRMGRVILLGSPRGPVTIDLHDEVHTLGLQIIGAHNSTHPQHDTPHTPWPIPRDVEMFLEWQGAGVMDVRPLITHRYSWRQTAEAFLMLLEDRTRAIGVVLDWTAD